MLDLESQSYKPLLDRELSTSNMEPLDDIAFRPLREAVNEATRAAKRCLDAATSSKDAHAAPFSLYRQSIQLADGIEVLLSKSCAEAAIPLLRSLFETVLGLKYILEDNDSYRARSLACLVGDTQRRLAFFKVVRDGKITGELASRLGEKYVEERVVPEIEKLETALHKPHMEDVLKAYRERRERWRFPRWYSLDNEDLTTLGKLAAHLDCKDMYLLGYSRWSGVVHGNSVTEAFAPAGDGEASVKQLRHPEQLCHIAERTLDFLSDATLEMLGRFRPAEEVSMMNWYESKIIPAMERLKETKLDFNPPMEHDW